MGLVEITGPIFLRKDKYMEEWRKSKQFPKYEASSEGRIRNSKTGRILKTQINDHGYERLTLRRDKKQHSASVHRIIADAFYDIDGSDLEVNHIDGNKLNNRIDNLEYCTRSANTLHALKMKLRTPPNQIGIKVVETGEVYNSVRECARSIDCDPATIRSRLRGYNKPYKGYHFERFCLNEE